MSASLVLSLREGVSLATGAEGELAVQCPYARFTFKHISPALRAALEQLTGAGAREDRLTDVVHDAEGPAGLARLYYYLERLGKQGLVLRSAYLDGQRLATLTPISGSFVFETRQVAPVGSYALSRFAYMHRLENEMAVESPLSHARLTYHDWRAAAFIHLLVAPFPIADAPAQIPGLTAEAAHQLLTLLVASGLAQEMNGHGKLAEDGDSALQTWEFHDLLFHARSRTGRHDNPLGGTYRFVGRLDSPPALKPVVSRHPEGTRVELYRPDLERLRCDDPPFAQVQETRRSIREFGDPPISAQQLGEFLYRIGRVKERLEQEIPTPLGPVRMDFARRPYPGGGALYELELYLVVNSCTELASGLYRYDPLAHQLETISGRTSEVEFLLRSASGATGIPAENIQVLLIVAARFQRVAWKYSSMAYAVILKHVGVLYQTMYLAATAMGLAPCGIGCGDSDLFCRAAGTDYYTESSVGEFLLGSRKPEA